MWETNKETGLIELSRFQRHTNKITACEIHRTGGGKPLWKSIPFTLGASDLCYQRSKQQCTYVGYRQD